MPETGALRTAELWVPSKPAPQGNHRISASGHIYEANAAQLRAWRDAVTFIARLYWTGPPMTGAVRIAVSFILPRPKSAPERPWPIVRPDADKLLRAVLDALTAAQIWRDDSQVVDVHARKLYANSPGSPTWIDLASPGPGAWIELWELA
jgi:Holliday junction resolvase RusA-like endonuclease